MKCDELKKRHYSEMDSSNPDDEMYYPANKVDAAIAELKAEVNNLLMQNSELCQALQVMYSAEEYTELQDENTELKEETLNLKAKNIELQSFYDLHGNVDNYIDKLKAENARLKDKRLDVKDAAHILKAFKFYLCQLTHCAYDERTAQWIIDNWEQDYKRVEVYK